jgi:hypothetical protein
MGYTYLVYTPNGWWGNAGTYVSEIKDAKTFTLEEAVAFCKKRFNSHTGINAVPVAEGDILRITSQ